MDPLVDENPQALRGKAVAAECSTIWLGRTAFSIPQVKQYGKAESGNRYVKRYQLRLEMFRGSLKASGKQRNWSDRA